MSSATLPNTPASTASGARDASRLPASAATTIGVAQRLASSQSTAPRAWCVRAELMDVGNDGRERGRHRDVHAVFLGHAGEAQRVLEHRHGDDAAAHAEQAGGESGDDARHGEDGDERQQLSQVRVSSDARTDFNGSR